MEAFGDKGMLTAKNELTITVELAASEGHLMPSALWSFPDRYKDAYRAELSSFVDLVRADVDSDVRKREQQDMLRHPRIVHTATAAHLSCKLQRQVFLSEGLDKVKTSVWPLTTEEVKTQLHSMDLFAIATVVVVLHDTVYACTLCLSSRMG